MTDEKATVAINHSSTNPTSAGRLGDDEKGIIITDTLDDDKKNTIHNTDTIRTPDGITVRVIDRAGEPWFVLADVCKVLDIGNSRMAADRLDEDEKDGVIITDPLDDDERGDIIISDVAGRPNRSIINHGNASARLDDDEKNTVIISDGIRGNPNQTIISHGNATSRLGDDEKGVHSTDTLGGSQNESG